MGGNEEGEGAGLEEREAEHTHTQHPCQTSPNTSSSETPAHSPDAHGGLDQRGDSHRGENGPDQLTDGVLVSAHAHGFSQQKRHRYRPAEAGEVMLQAEEKSQSPGRRSWVVPQGIRGAFTCRPRRMHRYQGGTSSMV